MARVAGSKENPRATEFPSSCDSGRIPAGPWVEDDRPVMGFKVVAGLRPTMVERERIEEREGEGRRESVW